MLRTHTEIVALEGDDHLERVRWRNIRRSDGDARHPARLRHDRRRAEHGWLEGCVALDAKGFIKTGPDLSPDDLAAARWPLARAPHLLETSLPGVFAVGDVRGGNIKRVASAVGEGSIAVSFVHQVLHEWGRRAGGFARAGWGGRRAGAGGGGGRVRFWVGGGRGWGARATRWSARWSRR